MYLFHKCEYPHCKSYAISRVNQEKDLLEDGTFCLKHCPSPEEESASIISYIMAHDKIINLNADGISLDNLEFGNKKFYGCNFQHSSFNNIHSNQLRARMCMFDFSTFSDCSFTQSNIQFSSFSGSKIVHVTFTGSDLIHNNFNGITSYQSSFDDSDLYNSRFIKAILINTSMINCNLKKAAFYEAAREGVSFKLSNTREALLDRRKGGMIGEIGPGFDEAGDEK
ncbi:MAG: pentapeptide repeat-containing protein [Treponema sp.]|nr:pentapeptide repeat-containing protein [Treponema sp.]